MLGDIEDWELEQYRTYKDAYCKYPKRFVALSKHVQNESDKTEVVKLIAKVEDQMSEDEEEPDRIDVAK